MYHTAQPCPQMKLRARAHRHDIKRAGNVYLSIVKTKENEECIGRVADDDEPIAFKL